MNEELILKITGKNKETWSIYLVDDVGGQFYHVDEGIWDSAFFYRSKPLKTLKAAVDHLIDGLDIDVPYYILNTPNKEATVYQDETELGFVKYNNKKALQFNNFSSALKSFINDNVLGGGK